MIDAVRMTSIDQLIAQPEGKTLEFKRDLSSPKRCLKRWWLLPTRLAVGWLLVWMTAARSSVLRIRSMTKSACAT